MGWDRFLRMRLRLVSRVYRHGLVLRVLRGNFTDMEYSLFFVCFEHCAERYLCPYYRLLRGFDPVPSPTYRSDDCVFRRHIYSIRSI